MRSFMRAGAVVVSTGALLLAGSGAALAHECFNASRSDQGDAMAGTRSHAWFTLVVRDVIAEEVGSGMYDEATGQCILEHYYAGGGPESFVIHVAGPHTLAENAPTSNLTDGRGIDHLFDAYGELIVGSYAACGVDFPME